MRFLRNMAVVALMSGTVMGVAQAGEITYTGYSLLGTNVHITDLPSVNNEYAGSGLITLTGGIGTPISVFCVDVFDWLAGGGTFNTANPATDPNLTGNSFFTGDTKIADIGALIFNGMELIANPQGGTSAEIATAIQNDIWLTEYGNNVSVTPDDSAVNGLATTYLADLSDAAWTMPSGYALNEITPANGEVNQSQVYLTEVPEPASVMVLMMGMLGVTLRRRQVSRS